MSINDRVQELVQDTGAVLALLFAVVVGVWAIQNGELDPQLVVDLIELITEALQELVDTGS